MKHRHIASFMAAGLTCAFFSLLVMTAQYLCAQQGQYRMQGTSSMQGSEAMQNFKAQQQQKMQQYLSQFEKENKEFLNTLMATQGREEKIEAVRGFINMQYNKNSAFRKQMYEEQRAFIEKQLDANPNMQPFMKNQMLARIDQDYAELKDFHAGKIQEDMAFLDGLIKDKSIDGQELNAELQGFFQTQKADAQEFLKNQQQKYQNRQRPSASSVR